MLYLQKNIKTLNFSLYERESLQKVAGYIPQAKPAVISNCYEQIWVQHFSKLLRCRQSENMHAKYFYNLGNLATNQQLLVWACVLNPLCHKIFVQFVLEILSYHVLSFPRKVPCEVAVNATYGETSTLTSQNSFIRAAITKIINYFFQLTWGNRTP